MITTTVLRRATSGDIPAMLRLINAYAAQKIMLPRAEFELAGRIHEFIVVYAGKAVAGCGALHVYSAASAEIRSLAVEPAKKARGIGRLIVDALVEEADRNNVETVFALTYVSGFFRKLGFTQARQDSFPEKIANDCVRCPKFQCCDEIAMMKRLRPALVTRTALFAAKADADAQASNAMVSLGIPITPQTRGLSEPLEPVHN